MDAGDTPDDAVKTIGSLLENKSKIIIPLSRTDLITASKPRSYYTKPFEQLTQLASLIYQNGYYNLFYS
jgi:hypothetical protein